MRRSNQMLGVKKHHNSLQFNLRWGSNHSASGSKRLGQAIIVFALLINNCVIAHDQIPGQPQTRPIAIRNATIHCIDKPVLENGTIVFDRGKIVAVGKKVKLPKNVLEIQAEGKHVYPGLIDSLTDLGLREILAVEETDDRREFGRENPNVRSWVAVNPDSELIPVARAGGVLVAMTAPSGPFIRGQSAVIQLDGWTVEEMMLSGPAGLFVDWSSVHPRDSNDSKRRQERERRLEEFDELLGAVRLYAKGRQSSEEFVTNVRLESLLPLINREMPLIAHADLQSEIESAVTYAVSQNLDLIIYGGYDAERCSELLKQHRVPVIIASTYRLPLRRDDPYDHAYTLPSRLKRAGVAFSIGGPGLSGPGGSASARNLPYHAAVASAFGLSEEQAVEAITLSAAKILKLEDRIGSITPEKDATLIIADGNILETETNVVDAYIQGRKVDLGSRHKMLNEKYLKKYSSR